MLEAQGLKRVRRTTESACSPRMHVEGQTLLSFNSNDYLGLAADPRVIEALREGVARYGAGSGASHLVSGHSRPHARLEALLAHWQAPHIDQAGGLYFSTGYMANIAVLAALSQPDPAKTIIFSDALNHASLIDGARLSRSQVVVYPHGQVEALEALMQAHPATNSMVVTDSVFSMDGDLAPLPDLLALCARRGAWLVVDDAHGLGVLGEQGAGALEHFGLRSPHLVWVGTLGKAAGVCGACVVAHQTVIEWMVQKARSYIYTTAAPPALADALLTSLSIVRSPEGAQRRAQLAQLRQSLAGLVLPQPLQLSSSTTPIQPLIVGGNEQVLRLANALYARGLWISAIRAPTVPVGTARLRITLSAAHTLAQVDQLKQALLEASLFCVRAKE
jgi:8-amino-7-oxononanoate synthase